MFLLDESWEEAEAAGRSRVPLPEEIEGAARHSSDAKPLHAIGYWPEWLAGRCVDAGLTVETIRLGTWCGREGGKGGQDTLVLRPSEAPLHL